MTTPPTTPDEGTSRKGRDIAIVLAAALVTGVLAVVVIVLLSDSPAEPETVVAIEGVEQYEIKSRDHTVQPVTYAQLPPVGGDHAPKWQNCGFYESPISTEQGVHSLEHGAVWITYDPDLPADQVEQLRTLGEEEFVLISPWVDGELPSPIVFSAWGVQQTFDELPDPATATFLETYRQAASSPEPGAPCTGGDSEPR